MTEKSLQSSPTDRAEPVRPWTVTAAVILYLVAAGLRFVSVVIGLTTVGAAHDDALRQVREQADGQAVNMAMVESALWTGVVVTTIVALVFVAAFVGLALALRRGWGWARWVLLGVAVLSISWLATLDPVSVVALLLVVVATVLIFLPPSLAWYRAERLGRIPARFRS